MKIKCFLPTIYGFEKDKNGWGLAPPPAQETDIHGPAK
jgi:hypothetical protein